MIVATKEHFTPDATKALIAKWEAENNLLNEQNEAARVAREERAKESANG